MAHLRLADYVDEQAGGGERAKLVNSLEKIPTIHGREFSTKKTKHITFGKDSVNVKITVGGLQLETVKQFNTWRNYQ